MRPVETPALYDQFVPITSKRYVQDAERLLFPVLEARGVGGVRDELVRGGVPRDRAGRFAWFVQDHYDMIDDGLSEGTRVNYRRDLRRLLGDPGRPRGSSITSDTGDDGTPIMVVM